MVNFGYDQFQPLPLALLLMTVPEDVTEIGTVLTEDADVASDLEETENKQIAFSTFCNVLF